MTINFKINKMDIQVKRLQILGNFLNLLSTDNVAVKSSFGTHHFEINKQAVTCTVKRFNKDKETPIIIGTDMPLERYFRIMNEIIQESESEITISIVKKINLNS